MSINTVVERHRKEVTEEIDKLRPVVDEYEALIAYRDSMMVPNGKGPARTSATVPAMPAPKPAKKRRRSGVNRQEQFLATLQEHPGAKISELAKIMDVSGNYLYGVRDKLVEAKKVRKEGDGHFLV